VPANGLPCHFRLDYALRPGRLWHSTQGVAHYVLLPLLLEKSVPSGQDLGGSLRASVEALLRHRRFRGCQREHDHLHVVWVRDVLQREERLRQLRFDGPTQLHHVCNSLRRLLLLLHVPHDRTHRAVSLLLDKRLG